MADQLSLFATGNMAAASVIAITSEATGYPKTKMLNQNLDDFYKPTGTGTLTIDIDLGSAKDVIGLFLWIRNYAAVSGANIEVKSSSNNITYSSITSRNDAMTREAILYQDAVDTKRYWRIIFTSLSAVPEIAMLALCNKYSTDQANNVPQSDVEEFFTRTTASESGRDLVQVINSRVRRKFARDWTFLSSTNRNQFRDCFRACLGNGYPVIFSEGPNASNPEPIPCRMGQVFEYSQPAYDIYDIRMAFAEIPSIPSGALY